MWWWHLIIDRWSLRINPFYIEMYLAYITNTFESLYMIDRRHIWPIEKLKGKLAIHLANIIHNWLIYGRNQTFLAHRTHFWPRGWQDILLSTLMNWWYWQNWAKRDLEFVRIRNIQYLQTHNLHISPMPKGADIWKFFFSFFSTLRLALI